MYPRDPTCILSTLIYICNLAVRHRISPIVSFEQSLFYQTSEIIYNSPENGDLKNIILILGSFHTLINVFGAVSTLMQGLELTGILETVLGENAVKYMMGGKAVQREFQGPSSYGKVPKWHVGF